MKEKKENNKVGALVVALLFWLIVGSVLTYEPPEQKPEAKKGLTRDQKIESYFSDLDGRNYALVRRVKGFLKDPASFEHVRTYFKDRGDSLTVIMQYRARNSFGAYVTEVCTAEVNPEDGRVRSITSR